MEIKNGNKSIMLFAEGPKHGRGDIIVTHTSQYTTQGSTSLSLNCLHINILIYLKANSNTVPPELKYLCTPEPIGRAIN